MAESEQIVNRIRRCLERQQGQPSEEAADLAQQYAEIVGRINDRLDRCVSLLRQGLGTEAIHQAELAPSVMTEALALQFEGLDRWRSLCQSQKLLLPPETNESAVIELDEALPHYRELNQLLKKHRQLALARAGLRPRIKILRLLSQSDSNNEVWGQDLEIYEIARHKQIIDEAKAASKRHDLEKIRQLQAECKEIWLVSPPDQTYEAIATLFAVEVDRVARKQLESIGEQLQTSLEQNDELTMRKTLSAWDHACGDLRKGGKRVDHSDAQQVRQQLDQIDHEKNANFAWKESLRAMEHSLDERLPMETIQRCWANLLKHEHAIPSVIQTRFDARCADVAVSSSRRFKLIMVGTLGALLLVGVSIGGLIYWNNTRQEIQQWHDQVTEAIEQGQWGNAQDMMARLEQQRPDYWQQPMFQGLVDQIDDGLKGERGRQQRLAQSIADVEAAGVESPNLEAMELAESLANSPEELIQVQTLRSAITRAQFALQQQRDEQFSKELTAVRNRFTTWQRREQTGDADFATLDQIWSTINQVLAQPKISSSLRSSAQPLSVSVGNTIKMHTDALARRQTIERALAEIRNAYTNPDRLILVMTQFVQQFPDHALARHFKRAVKIEPAFEAVSAWNTLRSLMLTIRVNSVTEAKLRLDMLKGYRDQYPSATSLASALKGYQAYLERANSTLASDNRADRAGGKLNSLLLNPLIDAVWMIQTRNGTRYYTKSDRSLSKLRRSKIRFSYASSPAQLLGEEPEKNKTLGSGSLSAAKENGLLKPLLSPQSQFAKQARLWVRDVKLPWEVVYLRLMRRVLVDQKMDPILQAALAARLGNWAIAQDWLVPKALQRITRVLTNLDTDLAWMSPDDPSVAIARSQIRSQLQDLEQLPDADATFRVWMDQLNRDLGARQIVGLIWQDADQGHVVLPMPSLANSMVLQAPILRGGVIQLVTLAHTATSKFVWDSNLANIPVGTPVYQVTIDPSKE